MSILFHCIPFHFLHSVSGEAQTNLSPATSSSSSRECSGIPVISGKCNPTGESGVCLGVSVQMGVPEIQVRNLLTRYPKHFRWFLSRWVMMALLWKSLQCQFFALSRRSSQFHWQEIKRKPPFSFDNCLNVSRDLNVNQPVNWIYSQQKAGNECQQTWESLSLGRNSPNSLLKNDKQALW